MDFLKKTLRWLWPSLFIMVFLCVRKTVFESLNFDQIQEGLLLSAGYLLCIVPLGIILSKSKWFSDESKTALMIVFITYIFFEYSAIISSWEQFAGHWVEQYFFNKQNTVFIVLAAFCGLGLMLVLRIMNNKRKNRAVLLFTILILAIVPCVDLLLAPNYKFDSDLFHIQQSNSAVTPAAIPQRIFWIILDEHPSSFMLNKVWGYKDTTFRSGLESLGFTVYDSCVSNYNFTSYSIAATTYGAMLPIDGQEYFSVQQMLLLREKICQSPVLAFFKSQEFEIHNLSLYDKSFCDLFKAQNVPDGIVIPSILGMILSKLDNQQAMPQMFYNRRIIDSLHTLLKLVPNNGKRIFVYAHILMPHSPYLPLETTSMQKNDPFLDPANDQAFLLHVGYTDSTILNVLHKGLDSLSSDQRSNTIVILQADHGYRFLRRGGKDIQLKSSFGILNAVLWPKNSKAKFYNGMSSANTFRILFRDVWGVKLNTLKDSSVNVYLKTEN
jgi:Sulfatase